MRAKLFVIGLAAVCMCGCSLNDLIGKKDAELTYKRQGDTAPAFKKGGDLKAFAVGQWEMTEDTSIGSDLAKQLGVSSINNQNKEEQAKETFHHCWDIKPDGTLSFYHGGFKLGGTWAVNGEQIDIDITTIDGKPKKEKEAEIKKSSETGTQIGVEQGLFFDWMQENLPKLAHMRVYDDPKRLGFLAFGLNGAGFYGMTLARAVKE